MKKETKVDDQVVVRLRRELEEVIIKVNYHFSSGYERHVNLQTPESIFLNFLKKFITEISSPLLYRISRQDFTIIMDSEKRFIEKLTFSTQSNKHNWVNLDNGLQLLSEAALLINFNELSEKSHTLEKWYQVTSKLINEISDFQFT